MNNSEKYIRPTGFRKCSPQRWQVIAAIFISSQAATFLYISFRQEWKLMPTEVAETPADTPLHGMDYGVPPRYMLMANPALIELWNQAKCIGLGYLQLPQYGPFKNVPCVGVMFDDVEKAIPVFKLLQSWDCEPGSGRGTDISFVEDKTTNSYTMTVGPNTSEMIRRLVEPSMTDDYSLMTMGMSVGKTLTLSAHFAWLRSQPRDKPIIFAPGDKRGITSSEHVLAKSDVQFFDKRDVPKNSMEYVMLSREEDSDRWENPEPPFVDPIQISSKRKQQLNKFFPIALSRLEYNPTFVRVAQQLEPGREHWQVVQAACNLLCRERFPAFRTELGKLDFHKAYDPIRQAREEIGDTMPINRKFTVEEVEAQIAEDLKYLFGQVRPAEAGNEPIASLRALGLLR